jgi:hypothetical protein
MKSHPVHSDSVSCSVPPSNFLQFSLLSIRLSYHITSISNIPVEWERHKHEQIKLRWEFNLCIFMYTLLEWEHKNKNWMNKLNMYFVKLMIREFVWILLWLLYFGFVAYVLHNRDSSCFVKVE